MFREAALAFAALLLIIPGFADIISFLLIFPPTRKLFFSNLKKYSYKKSTKEDFIEGEAEDIDDKMVKNLKYYLHT